MQSTEHLRKCIAGHIAYNTSCQIVFHQVNHFVHFFFRKFIGRGILQKLNEEYIGHVCFDIADMTHFLRKSGSEEFCLHHLLIVMCIIQHFYKFFFTVMPFHVLLPFVINIRQTNRALQLLLDGEVIAQKSCWLAFSCKLYLLPIVLETHQLLFWCQGHQKIIAYFVCLRKSQSRRVKTFKNELCIIIFVQFY